MEKTVGREEEPFVPLPQLLRARSQEFPDRVILEDIDGTAMTYAQLEADSSSWAASYAAAGIGKNDNVVAMLKLGLDYYRHWGALMWLGAVEISVNNEYSGSFLAQCINGPEATLLVTTKEFLPLFEEIADQLVHLKTVIVLDATAPDHGSNWTIVPRPGQADPPPPSVSPANPEPWDLASIIYTSGTTGRSKAVQMPWAHLHTTAIHTFSPDGLSNDDVFYLTSVTYHIGPKFALWAMSLLNGRIVTRNRFSSSNFWKDVREHECTIAVLISSMVPLVMAAPPSPDDASTPLRNVLMVPVIPNVDEFKERFDVRVATSYNMTETNCPIRTDWDVTSAGHETCGKARAGVEVRIVDEHDRELPPGRFGELILRSDEPWTLNTGYFGQPEATVLAWRNGWFHTGDGFRKDEDGNFYFMDKIKDSIRRRGENISSFEVEGSVNMSPDVLESAAIAVPSSLGGDELMVYAVKRPESVLTEADLVEELQQRLPKFMVPRYIEFIDELPKTNTDRIQKRVLRDRGFGPGTYDREALTHPAT